MLQLLRIRDGSKRFRVEPESVPRRTQRDQSMKERRRYFRLDDEFRVRFSLASEHALKQQGGLADARKLRLLISRIGVKSPEIADALSIMDRKINELIDESSLPSVSDTVIGFNISACGVAFPVVERLEHGARLNLEMLFENGTLSIASVGKVIGCEAAVLPKKYAGRFLARVDFTEMHGDDRELLIQYTLKRQGEQIRNKVALEELR